jgi:hypothetical protein
LNALSVEIYQGRPALNVFSSHIYLAIKVNLGDDARDMESSSSHSLGFAGSKICQHPLQAPFLRFIEASGIAGSPHASAVHLE